MENPDVPLVKRAQKLRSFKERTQNLRGFSARYLVSSRVQRFMSSSAAS